VKKHTLAAGVAAAPLRRSKWRYFDKSIACVVICRRRYYFAMTF